MKKLYLIIILFLCCFITGCWNYKELNQLAIVTGMSIDIDEDNKYSVSFMVANSKKKESESNSGTESIVYKGTGKTVTEAVAEIERILPKELYLGHLEVIIFSDKLAKKGLDNVLDYIIRKPESPNKFFTLLSKDTKAEDILKTLSPLQTFPSENISYSLTTTSESNSISNDSNYMSFITDILVPGKEPIMSSIELVGEVKEGDNLKDLENTKPKSYTKISELGIFKNFKLKEFADKTESMGINIINNKANKFILNMKCKDSYLVTSIDSIKSNIKIDDNNIEITAKGNGYISEVNCDIDLLDNKIISNIEKDVEKEIKNMLNDSIKLAIKNKTDIFGIGNLIYKKDYKRWEELKDEWNDEYFPNLNFNIKVDMRIKSKGTEDKTIKGEKDE